MQLPSFISDAIQKTPFDNKYFYGHEDMRKSLDRVADGTDTYASYHYSMLINDLELCLKGFLQYKKDIGEWEEPHANFLTEDHKIYKLIEQVQKFIPLFSYTTKDEWYELKRFTSNLCREYTMARYGTIILYNEFLDLNNKFVVPLNRKIYDELNKIKEKETDLTIGL